MSRSLHLRALASLLPLFLLGSTGMRAEASMDQVAICHQAGPVKRMTLHVSENGATQHLAEHELDTPGACGTGGGDDL